MHILFIHTVIDISSPKFSPPIAVLSAVAKERGHKTSLLLVKDTLDENEIRACVQKTAPDLVAFSATTPQWEVVEQVAKLVKTTVSVPVICGGIHPTLCPEEVIASPWIDAICIGEGEFPLLEYLEAMAGKRPFENIQNLWIKASRLWRRDRIYRNPMRPAIKDLDILPCWDIDIFDHNNFIQKNSYSILGRPGFFPFTSGRGCPYRCTYCCNSSLLEIYKGELGHYTRKHSIGYIMKELTALRSKYDIKGFEFWDEMLSADERWIGEFCARYVAEIGLPYLVLLRVEHASKKVMEHLRDSGCFMVAMGVECGNESFRKDHLNRRMSNQQIIDAFAEARKAGIKTLAWNMIGMPFETPALIRETIELNRILRPDILGFAVFHPFPKTKLYDICKQKGMLSGRKELLYSDKSVLDQKSISQAELTECFLEFQKLAEESNTVAVDWE